MTISLPQYVPVPRSNALVQPAVIGTDEPAAIVRCRNGHRVFDVRKVSEVVGHYSYSFDPITEERYEITRQCPTKCRTRNFRQVTTTPGFPCGESGEWRCVHCDGFLARVDASRGRLTVPCAKCAERVSATAADVFATRQANETPAEPESDDDFDDLPF